ncbi:MAG: hypothetical protein ACXWUG_25085 [Polyangiales bacterium]
MNRVLLLLLLVGCQGVKVEKDAGSSTCAKVGDSCMFEPGKLGLCVDGNVSGQGPPKPICQSQH